MVAKKEAGVSQKILDKIKKKQAKLSPEVQKKLKGGFLAFIGLFALIFIGSFLFGKLLKPQDVAELTPAKKTIALLEINIDGQDSQTKQFFDLLKNHKAYQTENFLSVLNAILPIDYEKELSPWLGRKIGVVFYESKVEAVSSPTNLSNIYFIESKNQNQTIEFLKNRSLDQAGDEMIIEDYRGFKMMNYKISQNVSLAFVNSYLVVCENQDTLTAFLDDLALNEKLSTDPDYRKVVNNLPQGALVSGYVHFQKLINFVTQDQKFVAIKGQDLLAFQPFLNLFRAEGFTLFAEKDRFVAQTFTSIDNQKLDEENFLTYNEKYEGKLLKLASKEPLFLAGGHDLTKEINRLESIFSSGTKTSGLRFESLIEAQKQKYFGKNIDLRKDIYPLLKREYLLTIDKSFEKPVITLFLQMGGENSNTDGFEKIMNEFIKVGGVSSSRIQEVTLPDGTIGKEEVATPEKIKKTSLNYEEASLNILGLGDTGMSLAYTTLKDTIVISNDGQNLKKIIDRNGGKEEDSLVQSKYYKKNMQPILRTADEVLHTKLGAVTEALNSNEILKSYLNPFESIVFTKNYFKDGISTIYFIDVI